MKFSGRKACIVEGLSGNLIEDWLKVLDLATFTVALAQEDGWRGLAIGDGGYVHANHSTP